MKKALSLFLSVVMVISTIACVDLSAYAGDVNISNRAEWLSKLVEIFDMTVESDDYPDNYFSDLTEGSKYYRDILVATEYGLISVEAGDPIYPEDDITREFAAQTLNACLGFQLETNEDGEYEYTFADVENCSFPDDDQIAFNRGWFELVDGNFCPGNVVTATEITAMFDDAKAQIEFTTVDEDYDSRVEVADDVVEIPNGTELSIDENGTITVVDCPVTINESDRFTAYFYDLPNAYVAQSVTVDGNKTIIATQEANAEEVFENVDIQEVSQIDDAEFIPADGFTVEPDDSQISTFALSRDSTPINSLNNVKIGGDITIDGIKLALSAKLSNPVLETKISNKNTYIGLNTDVDLSYSVSTKTSSKLDQTNKTSKLIPVGYINIFGVGYFKVSFEVSLSGGITIKEKFSLTMGESYAEGEDLRIIADFTHKDFSIAVEATLKAGYKFELGISIAIVKADVYASVGFAVKGTLTGYPSGTPSTCLNINGYMYLDIGAELTINLFFTSLHFGVEKAIIDSKNSPVKFAFHFEDGKKVHECTRGKTPKYLTPSDSKHSNSADDCVNNYENVDSSSFRYSVSNGNAKITGYTGSSSIVVIPEYIDGYKVTSIGRSAFRRCSSLTSVTIPNSVTSIGDYAFENCTSLTSVTLPNSVKSIGYCAFEYCTSLTSVTIDNGVTSIGNAAFKSCTNLTSVTIPDSVTSIGNSAFAWCTSLTSITIPNSVTSIGEGAFYDCTSLTSVTIPDSVTSIGDDAFDGRTSLTSITVDSGNANYSSKDGVLFNKTKTVLIKYPVGNSRPTYDIPNTVTSIGDDAFENCTSLTSVTIPNSVKSIGSYAFSNCTSLTSVTIGNSVTSIGHGAFYQCTSLTSVTIPDSVTSLGDDAFCGCSSLTSVTIGNGVTSIGAFAYCSSLTSVTIPNSVTSIGVSAFYNCTSLTSVTIPNSVKSIGSYAFSNCTSLTDVYYTGSEEEWYNILIDYSNDYLLDANVHYNYIMPCKTHKLATAVKENIKKATCTTAGSYDSVVYCSVCKHELNRTKKTIAKTAHTYKTIITKSTTSKNGSVVTKCTVCGAVKSKSTIYYPKTVTLSATNYTYDGKVKKPSVKVVGSNGKTISSSNYTVSYASGRKYVGKYAVKITFKGNYSGTKTLYFYIKPKSTSISSLTAGSKKFTVKWKKQATQTTGYQIQYSTSSKFTNAKTVTVGKNSTTYKTVSKLSAKKKYYVRIRTYKTVGKATYYSAWSKAKAVTTKK